MARAIEIQCRPGKRARTQPQLRQCCRAEYYTNFRVGDPYVKVDMGYARLPGSGYAALHPELDCVDPEDYPDIHKMATRERDSRIAAALKLLPFPHRSSDRVAR